MNIRTSILLLCLLGVSFGAWQEDYVKLSELKTVIPEELKAEIYSGYLSIPQTTKRLHYVLVSSKIDFKTDPLILIVPPKPGCSSMEQFLTEQSPIIVDQDSGKVALSLHSWDRNTSLLYLESLVSVGFSVAGEDKKVPVDDKEQVADIMAALPVFFDKFKELRDNDLYIAGRNYAGMLGPKVADAIHEFNRQQYKEADKIALKGLLLGNPFTSSQFDKKQAKLQALVGKGFITPDLYKQYVDACEFDERSEVCKTIFNVLWGLVEQLNHYNIYTKCVFNKQKQCIQFNDTSLQNFMNNLEVRKQFHIDNNANAWSICSENVEKSYTQSTEGALDIYMNLVPSRKYITTIYSGESDILVPTYGTQAWVKFLFQQLRISIEEPQRTWYIHGSRPNEFQVAGTITKYYGGFEYVTLHAAGHLACINRPAAVYKLMMSTVYKNRL